MIALSGKTTASEQVRPVGRTPRQLFWRRLRRNRTAFAGLYVLALLYGTALFAGFFAPYSYENAVTELSFHPPMLTAIKLFDEQGGLSRPFVYGTTQTDPQLATYQVDTSRKYPIRFFVRGDSYTILWIFTSNVHLFGVDTPSRIFLFGADKFGQ